MSSFLKDPQSELDFAVDWAAKPPNGPWLDDGETITSFAVTADEGITVGTGTRAPALTTSESGRVNGAVTVWLAGGTVGARYNIACRVTTNAGRTDERTIRVTVLQR